MVRADLCANSLIDKDFDKFWQNVNKVSNSKSTTFATSTGGSVGDKDISKMWEHHFNDLYNTIPDDGTKTSFYKRLQQEVTPLNPPVVTVSDIVKICAKQKRCKAAGPDSIVMEAFLYGGHRLYVHMSLLFSIFLRFRYLQSPFMESTIVPLVKCKSGDLTDVNNYRAIALSNAISKLFESVIACVCTSVFKITVDYLVNYDFGGSV
jgi:hypothetical protein